MWFSHCLGALLQFSLKFRLAFLLLYLSKIVLKVFFSQRFFTIPAFSFAISQDFWKHLQAA